MPTLNLAINSAPAVAGAATFNAAAKSTAVSSRAAAAGVRTMDASMKVMGATAATTGSAIKSMLLPLVGIAGLVKTVSVMAKFEQTMATVRGVTRATGPEFEALSDKAREMGATTRFSATEAGEGLLFLARAGFTSQQSMEALPATLNLAQAGAVDLGFAADVASNVLTQFDLSAEETVRVVDSLVTTSNRSNTSVAQLAEALKFAGTAAGKVGVSVEETAASIGVLGDAGIQASMAGTNMRGIFASLLNPTKKIEGALANLGLTFDQVDISQKSVIEVMETFKNANLDASNAATIFGRRNFAAALQLTANVDKVKELTTANKENVGSASEMARVMDETLVGSLKALVSIVQELMLQVGQGGLGGVIRGMVDVLVDALRIIGGMGEELKTSGGAARAMAVAITSLTASLVTMVVLKIAGFFLGVASAIGKVIISMKALRVAMLTNPFTAIAVGVGALVALLISVKDRTFEFGDTTVTVGDFIMVVWDRVVKFFKFVWDFWVAEFKAAWKLMGLIVEKAVELLVSVWNNTVGVFIDNWKIGIDSVVLFFKFFANTAIAAIETVIDFTVQSIKFAKNLLDRFIGETDEVIPFPSITKIAAENAAKDYIGAVIDTIDNFRRGDLKAAFEGVFGADFAADLEAKGRERAALSAGGLPSAPKPQADALDDVAKNANKAVTETEKVAKKLESAADQIGDSFGRTFTDIITGAKTAKEAIGSLIDEIFRLVVQQAVAAPIAAAITGGLTGVTNAALGVQAPPAPAPLAKGGIVTAPKTGLIGEAGPEAIIPLRRRSDGELGIATGRSIVVNMNVTTPGADSFRKSNRQIVREFRKAMTGI